MTNQGEPTFHLTKRGSATLCEFQRRSFAIIAAHTLRNDSLERVRIPIHDGVAGFFSFDHWWVPLGKEECHDIRLLHISTISNDGDWRGERAPIHQFTPGLAVRAFVPGGDFRVSGYPGIGDNNIDYDKDVVINQRFISQGEYRARDTSPYVHILDIRQNGALTDFGGYSGGFVTALVGEGLVPAGLVITGSRSSNAIRFIDIDALTLSLQNFTDQLDAP